MKYSDAADYLVAAIFYLGTNEKWWARTVPQMARELSLEEAKLRKVLESFPAIFRRSLQPVRHGTEYLYSLQARYALKLPVAGANEPSEEDAIDVGYLPDAPPLSAGTLEMLISFVRYSADSEARRRSNWLAAAAAVVSAIAAIIAAFVTR